MTSLNHMPIRSNRGPSSSFVLGVLTLCALALLPGTAWAIKTDILVLKNGDRVTGEVRSLTQGQLQYSTDTMGTIYVDWNTVEQVISKASVQIETTTGARYYGQLTSSSKPQQIAIAAQGGLQELSTDAVVRISPIKQSFWDSLQGSLSVGLSYTKSSEVSQVTVNGAVSRRTRYRVNSLKYNAIYTDQVAGSTAQVNLTGTHIRFRENRWFTGVIGSYQSNEQLGIENRFLLGAGGGRELFETNYSSLSLGAGLDVNFEDTVGTEGANESLEAFFGLDWDMFKHHSLKHTLSLGLVIYPSITESGRLRSQLDMQWRQELASNLFLDWSLYGQYDSDPPQGALSQTDYGIVTSLGYSFWP